TQRINRLSRALRSLGMMRRRLPWLVALPLMAAGSLAAHALSFAFVGVRAEGAVEGQEGAERARTGLASHSVLGFGILAALVAVAAVLYARARLEGRHWRGASHWLFLALP